MKKVASLFGIALILGMLITITSCEKNQDINSTSSDQVEYLGAGNSGGSGSNYNFDSTGPLTQDEINGVLFMREEEKLAHDVYVNFFSSYGDKVFDNISKSEQKHTDAVLALITFYGLTDPALPTPGSFSDPALQTLYNDLIAQGSTSVEDALGVGALIEEVDIIDLEDEMAITSNPNLIMVYTNLLNGSYNHLRAFVRVLDSYGILYQPQLLDTTIYNQIINAQGQGHNGSGNGTGNGNGGNGNGGNGNGGNGNGGNGNGGNGNGGNGNGGNGNGGNGNGGNGNGGVCPNDTIN